MIKFESYWDWNSSLKLEDPTLIRLKSSFLNRGEYKATNKLQKYFASIVLVHTQTKRKAVQINCLSHNWNYKIIHANTIGKENKKLNMMCIKQLQRPKAVYIF